MKIERLGPSPASHERDSNKPDSHKPDSHKPDSHKPDSHKPDSPSHGEPAQPPLVYAPLVYAPPAIVYRSRLEAVAADCMTPPGKVEGLCDIGNS